MKTLLSSVIILSTLAGTTFAQSTYVSGLEHAPTGNAVLGTPEGRRLPVYNIGSSGQDGVEIFLRSTVGGGTGVEIAPVLAAAGGEIKIKHKGWDGLIYGNHRVTSNGDGTGAFHFDFSNLGVTGLQITEFNENGEVISDVSVAGDVANRPWVPNFTCPNGGTPILWLRWISPCYSCQPVLVVGWMCLTSTTVTGEYSWQGRMMVRPTTGPGTPPLPPFESALIAAAGVPSITLTSASIDTLGLPAWGVGNAHIGEVCDDTDGDGDCDARRLPVSNLGSSGQDGVSLDLGPNAGGFQLSMARGNCCRGHVTLMKAYDDGNSEARLILTQEDPSPLGPEQTIDADFSHLGASGFILTCYDATGAVIGSPQAIPNGGLKPLDTGMCPGSDEVWEYDHSLGQWLFRGCLGTSTQRITFPNGLVYDGVATFALTPLNPIVPAAGSRIRHVVITKNGTEMELKRVVVRPPTPTCGDQDFNGDGDLGTDADIEAFFACLGGNCCTTCYEGGSDFNADGDYGTDADIESFFRVLGGGPC